MWLALVASVALDPERSDFEQGVVVAPEVVARAADSPRAAPRFAEALPSGTEVVVEEDRGGWLRVRLHNARTGWVPAAAVARVGRAD